MKSFLHPGDGGDILYALPSIRFLGGGDLYLQPGHEKTRLTVAGVDALKPLLLQQPYVKSVSVWNGEPVDYDFGLAREHDMRAKNLTERYGDLFGVPHYEFSKPWLRADYANGCGVVFARSARYHNPKVNWRKIRLEHPSAVFLGLPEEHAEFCREFGYIRYEETADLLQAARWIAGCHLFVGNQSCLFAIAEGMKKNAWLETVASDPNCNYRRDNLWLMKEY